VSKGSYRVGLAKSDVQACLDKREPLSDVSTKFNPYCLCRCAFLVSCRRLKCTQSRNTHKQSNDHRWPHHTPEQWVHHFQTLDLRLSKTDRRLGSLSTTDSQDRQRCMLLLAAASIGLHGPPVESSWLQGRMIAVSMYAFNSIGGSL
jgi:hypothetical protein